MKRPQSLDQYFGQSRVKPMLALELKTGFVRPVIIFGQSGVGKTALANALACELGGQFHEFVAQESWTESFITDMLMSLSINGYDDHGRPGKNADTHVVFIDEAQAMGRCQTALFRPIEDGHVYDATGQPNWLPRIVYILATTNPEKIASALMNRMKLQLHLTPYTDIEIEQIVNFNFPDMSMSLVKDVARRSKGVPRLALSYAESVQLYEGDAETFFGLRGIDERGLDERDREYLAILSEANRPLSLNSIAAALRESPAIVRMMESHLLFMGLVTVSPSGRQISAPTSRGKRAA